MILERKFSWNCFENNSIFFHLSPTSYHFHRLQVENCGSNSRLVVDENDTGKFRLQRVYQIILFLSCEFLIDSFIFRHLKMEIASAIPALNE